DEVQRTRDGAAEGRRGGVLDTSLAVAEQTPGVDDVEDVTPAASGGEAEHAAARDERGRAAAASPCEQCKDGKRQRDRQLGAEADSEREPREQRFERLASQQEECRRDRERGGDEIVLCGRRLERDEAQRRQNRGSACRRPGLVAEPARGAVDGDEDRELRDVLRQGVERRRARDEEEQGQLLRERLELVDAS